jgi:hypothetical protein
VRRLAIHAPWWRWLRRLGATPVVLDRRRRSRRSEARRLLKPPACEALGLARLLAATEPAAATQLLEDALPHLTAINRAIAETALAELIAVDDPDRAAALFDSAVAALRNAGRPADAQRVEESRRATLRHPPLRTSPRPPPRP